jgi:hypothetical protein
MAFFGWFIGSLIIWGWTGGPWGAAVGVCFVGLGFIALWLWPQWNYEPGLRLFRDAYMTIMTFFVFMALDNAGVIHWLVFLPTMGCSLLVLKDIYIRVVRHRQQTARPEDFQA